MSHMRMAFLIKNKILELDIRLQLLKKGFDQSDNVERAIVSLIFIDSIEFFPVLINFIHKNKEVNIIFLNKETYLNCTFKNMVEGNLFLFEYPLDVEILCEHIRLLYQLKTKSL